MSRLTKLFRRLRFSPSCFSWVRCPERLAFFVNRAVYFHRAFSRVLPRPDLEKVALDRNPLHRFGTIEELANLAAFLVSDGSGYINGEVIRMDGGEFLQGAGEFSGLGRMLKDEDWEALKPRKRSQDQK